MIKQQTKKYVYLIAIYYLVAPLEDILTIRGLFGTLAKYIMIAAILAAVLELRGQIAFRFTTVTMCIISLSALSIFSILWSRNVDVTMARIPTYLLLPCSVMVIGSLPFNEDDYSIIVDAAIMGGILTTIVLYTNNGYQLGSAQRLSLNDANDPNNFAALLFLPAMLCLKKTHRNGDVSYSLIRLVVGFFLVILLLYTGSRGAVLALVLSITSYILLVKAYKELRYYIVAIVAITLFVKFILPSLSPELFNRYFNRNLLMYDLTQNEGQRGKIWEIIILRILPNMPPFGMGAGCSGIALSDFYGHITGSHNTYLCMVIEYGFLGLPFFLRMLHKLFSDEVKRSHMVEAAILIGICVIIFFLDSYAKKFFWNVVMLVLIDIQSTFANNGIHPIRQIKPNI